MEHQVNTKLTKIEKVFDKIDAFIDSANSEKYCDWSCKKN
jgi:hypothetical protein